MLNDPGTFKLETRFEILGTRGATANYKVSEKDGTPEMTDEAYTFNYGHDVTLGITLEAKVLPDMKKEVFAPLGMKSALVDNENLILENRVQGYALEKGVRVPVNKSYNWLFGAGDVVGTVDDVYRLNVAYKRKLLLLEKTWQEIVTPSTISQMGLGNTVSKWHGKFRIQHNGGHNGFRTLHVQLPEDDFDVILLSNSGYGDARNVISEMIYQEFYGDNQPLGEVIEMDKGYIH